MTSLFKLPRMVLAAALAGTLGATLAGCGGGGGGAEPPIAVDPLAVPGSALVSVAAFSSYVGGAAASETAEPLGIPAGLVPPASESDEPI